MMKTVTFARKTEERDSSFLPKNMTEHGNIYVRSSSGQKIDAAMLEIIFPPLDLRGQRGRV